MYYTSTMKVGRLVSLGFLLTCIVILTPWSGWGQAVDQVCDTALANGLKLITCEDHAAPLVSVGMYYHVGSKDEPIGYSGISKVCRWLMLDGTPTFKKGEYARIIQGGGGSMTSYSGYDMSMFGATVPTAMLDTILILGADQMQNVNVTFERLLSAKEVVRKERLTWVESSVYGVFNEELFNLAYRVHPYKNAYYGWPADVAGLTVEDVAEYIKTYYQPANAAVIVVGDFDTERVTKRVVDLYGSLLPRKMSPRKTIVEPEPRGERRTTITGVTDIPVVLVAYHVPAANHPDRAALEALSSIMYQGGSSRLYRRLIDEDNAALSVYGGVLFLEDPGLMFFYAVLNYDFPVDQGEQLLLEEIDRLKTEYVSDFELEKTKNQMEAYFYRESRTLSQKMSRIAGHQFLFGDWRLLDRRISGARSITREDIRRVASQYLTRENRTVAVLVPEDYFKAKRQEGAGK